jgi:hypothetical protein
VFTPAQHRTSLSLPGRWSSQELASRHHGGTAPFPFPDKVQMGRRKSRWGISFALLLAAERVNGLYDQTSLGLASDFGKAGRSSSFRVSITLTLGEGCGKSFAPFLCRTIRDVFTGAHFSGYLSTAGRVDGTTALSAMHDVSYLWRGRGRREVLRPLSFAPFTLPPSQAGA